MHRRANKSLKPQYGNWVSEKLLYFFGIASGANLFGIMQATKVILPHFHK